jgi:hypothetical protein
MAYFARLVQTQPDLGIRALTYWDPELFAAVTDDKVLSLTKIGASGAYEDDFHYYLLRTDADTFVFFGQTHWHDR